MGNQKLKNSFIFVSISGLLLTNQVIFGQAGSGTKYGPKNQAYVDSIKNSDYKWALPIWGKKASKKGFDLPYAAGIMLNTYIGSQKVLISDLKVGINDKEPVPLDFIKFGDVKAKIQSITVRPDVWILPFLDLYAIAGGSFAQTNVNVASPINFTTEAEFKGKTFGLGTTIAGGYHGFIFIADFNHTWTQMDKIDGTIQSTMVDPRFGMNFLSKGKPSRSVAFWIGAQGIFINRTTEGNIDLGDLTSNATKPDLDAVVSETADWVKQLPPAQKEVVKYLAQKSLDKLNGVSLEGTTISYSLIKKPTSNWSMCIGSQYQFSHRWQVRTEVGFFGGRESILISGNYRFRILKDKK